MKIKDYLPKKPTDKRLVQARVDTELTEKVREKAKREDIRWDELLTAMFKAYLKE